MRNEDDPIVRAVLGHFIFVFIHPYMEGNGRIGRFLMNVLWCDAGYPWTIVRLESRKEYLQSLEAASVNKNINTNNNNQIYQIYHLYRILKILKLIIE